MIWGSWGIDETIWNWLNVVIIIGILIHIRSEARRIQENWMHLIIPVILFWWLVYPLWLFMWPGLHRPSRRGKDPETFLPHTWAKRRIEKRRQKDA